jgi:hypothetical protein
MLVEVLSRCPFDGKSEDRAMVWASGNHLDDREWLWRLIRALPLACLPFIAGGIGLGAILRLADGQRSVDPVDARDAATRPQGRAA